MAGPVILDAGEASIAAAARAIRSGRAVGMPTETVYGLACDATDARAVAGVFDAKGRPRFDPLIVHLADAGDLPRVAWPLPEAAGRLAEALWPGPLTLVVRRREALPDLVTAGLETVGVRVPAHPVARRLIAEAGVPVAAPSANRFGRTSPTTAAHVAGEFDREAVPLVIDGGPCVHGLESTVVRVGWSETGDAGAGGLVVGDGAGRAEVLRVGAVTLEELADHLGYAPAVRAASSNPSAHASPGQHDRHYATATPLVLCDDETAGDADRLSPLIARAIGRPGKAAPRVGRLVICPGAAPETSAPGGPGPTGDRSSPRWSHVEALGGEAGLTAAAAGLFAAMRRLDAGGLDAIVATPAPGVGLGRAINDRLRRAAAVDAT